MTDPEPVRFPAYRMIIVVNSPSDCPSNHIPTHQAYIGGPAGEAIFTAEAQTGRPLSEDCLSVNVWTKPQTGEANKAVLFWIFGGGN